MTENVVSDPNELPDPKIHQHGLWAIHPFVLRDAEGNARERLEWQNRLVSPETFSGESETCWQHWADDQKNKKAAAKEEGKKAPAPSLLMFNKRGYLPEVANVFQEDSSDGEDDRVRPRFLMFALKEDAINAMQEPAVIDDWIEMRTEQLKKQGSKPVEQTDNDKSFSGLPALGHWKVGYVSRKDHFEEVKNVRIGVKLIVSRAGVFFVVLSLRRRSRESGYAISDISLLNRHLVFEDRTKPKKSLVMLPQALVSQMQLRNTDGMENSQAFTLTEDERKFCLSLSPQRHCKTPNPKSLVGLIEMDLKRRLGKADIPSDLYLAASARVPFVCGMGQNDYQGLNESVESICARASKHPKQDARKTYTLPFSELKGPEFQTLQVQRDVRMHLSCEGLTAFYDAKGNGGPLVGGDYLMTYLFALHHSIICQDMSLKSYTSKLGKPGTQSRYEKLLALLQEFDRDYNFAVVSNSLTTQALYRCAREVTGANRIHDQIKEELQGWLDSEQRNEDRKLNSFAVVAMMVGFSTFFIGLNLDVFTKDAIIEVSESKAWWLWGPTLIVLALTFMTPVRSYFRQAFQAIFGSSKSQ